MSHQIEVRGHTKNLQMSSREGVAVEAPDTAPAQKKRTFYGMLMIGLCCVVPLLLLAAIPFLGLTFGSFAVLGSGLLSTVALLACPVGMYLMMRMMMSGKK